MTELIIDLNDLDQDLYDTDNYKQVSLTKEQIEKLVNASIKLIKIGVKEESTLSSRFEDNFKDLTDIANDLNLL